MPQVRLDIGSLCWLTEVCISNRAVMHGRKGKGLLFGSRWSTCMYWTARLNRLLRDVNLSAMLLIIRFQRRLTVDHSINDPLRDLYCP